MFAKQELELKPVSTLGTSENIYSVISEGIKETFRAIDRFELQACDDLKKMRDEHIFKAGGYKTFEEYCESELHAWGGYRRIGQLIGAKQVIDALQETPFSNVITRERQARPLLRLVKDKEKLQEAVAIACQNNPCPTGTEISKAVRLVAPLPHNANKVQEPRFLTGAEVIVSSQTHIRYGEIGVIAAEAPNHWQQIVEFENGRESIRNNDLDASSSPFPKVERTPVPKTYTEDELQRAIAEAKMGFFSELEAAASSQIQEELVAYRNLVSQKADEVDQLRRRLAELESLRELEVENELLKARVSELEAVIADKPLQDWGNTFNKQAEKVLNKEVKKMLGDVEKWDIRLLSYDPPATDQGLVVRLLSLSLEAASDSMPSIATRLRRAAAIILQVDERSIAEKASQLRQLDTAIRDTRACISSPYATGEELNGIVGKYSLIREEIWEALSKNERLAFNKLESDLQVQKSIQVGSRVSHSDKFNQLYSKVGTVVQFENDNFLVHWDGYEQPLFRHRYEANELRLI